MALRGTGFAKRPAGTAAIQAASAERLPEVEAAPTRAVPLDLAALVAPYRRHGRISLRIERLPHRARLSRGQNNGDRSWSLSFDELDGLHYLAPKDVAGEQMLSIRVVSLDGSEGATVAMLELVIPGAEIPRITTVEGDRSRSEGPAAFDQVTAHRLRSELAEAKAARSAQDAMLADLRQTLESDWEARAKQMVQSELASARSAWEVETKARVAEIAEQNVANLEQSRRTWQAEQDSRLAKSELEAAKHLEHERERWWKEFDAKLAQAEQVAKASEAQRLAAEDKLRLLASKGETYERARREFEADLSNAKSEWKEGEASRFADAEAQWQLKAKTLQSEAHDRLRKDFEIDLAKLRKSWQEGEAARLADVEATWRARSEKGLAEAKEAAIKEAEALRSRAQSEWKAQEEVRLSQTQQQSSNALAEVRARAEKEMQVALETAQRAWKASEVARFAAAETRWREESAKLIAEARERASGGDKSADSLQIGRLQEELVAANAALVNREGELAQLRQSLDDAGDGSRKQLETALANARLTWSEEEAARLVVAERQWGERSAKELSELKARHVSTASNGEAELKQLQAELATANAALVDRNSELMRVRSEAQVEAERQRLESEAAMVAAKNAWSVEERARVGAIEAKWREEVAAQAERMSRAQPNPPEPEVPVATPEPSAPRDGIELLKLRDELERLQSTMAVREVELAQARATAEQARARLIGEPIDLVQRGNSERILISTGRNRTIGLPERKRLPYRDIGIVAAVAILVFIFYPHIVSLLPFDWGSDSSYSDDAEPAPKPAAAPKPVVVKSVPTDVIVRSANVRSGPSKTATLISTLAADVTVRTIERNGNWAHIEFTAADAKKQDGWVYNTYLKSLSEATPAPVTESAP